MSRLKKVVKKVREANQQRIAMNKINKMFDGHAAHMKKRDKKR